MKNISDYIQTALKNSRAKHYDGSRQKIHRERSKNFVEELANLLRLHYNKTHPSYAVLSKHYQDPEGIQRRNFGLNELLYDILVCDTSQTKAKDLTYVTKAIWQIESEFAKDSRKAIHDFNKLILGSSENKLFIGPRTSDDENFIAPLKELVEKCHSNVFIALVPHPGDWDGNPAEIVFYDFQ